MLDALKSLASFLTIIPAKGSIEKAAASFHWAPLVTGPREALTGLTLMASLELGLPPEVSAALAFAAHLIVQGMHHFDGLVDAGEAMLASRAGRDPLTIMRDRHRGGFAIGVGLAYGILLWSLLEALAVRVTAHPGSLVPLLILTTAGAVSATGMYASLYLLPPPPYSGLGKLFKQSQSPRGLAVALSLPIIMSAALSLLHPQATFEAPDTSIMRPLASAVMGGLVSALLTTAAARRLIGYATGDVAGMVGELSFLGGLLASLMSLGW